jgi:hypothetical protein
MSATHFHLILNHIPVLGTAFGLGLLIFGLLRTSDEIKKARWESSSSLPSQPSRFISLANLRRRVWSRSLVSPRLSWSGMKKQRGSALEESQCSASHRWPP